MKLGQVSVAVASTRKRNKGLRAAAASRCVHFFFPAAAASKLRIDFLLKKEKKTKLRIDSGQAAGWPPAADSDAWPIPGDEARATFQFR